MKKVFMVLLLSLLTSQVSAKLVTENVSYSDGMTVMNGMLAYDDEITEPRPGVLVVHEWWGHNDYARKRAKMLAEQGYVAMSIDMYGDGKTADHPDNAGDFANSVGGNPELAKERFTAAMQTLEKHPAVAKGEIAAIGYCFGGGIVLNMARQGLDLKGVASFHGSLKTQTPALGNSVKAKVIVFNGEADPMVTAEQIGNFKLEMDSAGVDYQLINYPGVKHSFTNPDADQFAARFNLPLAYDAEADADSWQRLDVFLKEAFAR